jgi:hypothetical protein
VCRRLDEARASQDGDSSSVSQTRERAGRARPDRPGRFGDGCFLFDAHHPHPRDGPNHGAWPSPICSCDRLLGVHILRWADESLVDPSGRRRRAGPGPEEPWRLATPARLRSTRPNVPPIGSAGMSSSTGSVDGRARPVRQPRPRPVRDSVTLRGQEQTTANGLRLSQGMRFETLVGLGRQIARISSAWA